MPCPYDGWACAPMMVGQIPYPYIYGGINDRPLSLHDATIELRVKNSFDTYGFSARNIKRQKYP